MAHKTIADGHACNGICITGRKDDDIHFRVRHMIGHLLMSTYKRASPLEKYLPKWVYAGSGHWLARSMRKFRERATFCANPLLQRMCAPICANEFSVDSSGFRSWFKMCTMSASAARLAARAM